MQEHLGCFVSLTAALQVAFARAHILKLPDDASKVAPASARAPILYTCLGTACFDSAGL